MATERNAGTMAEFFKFSKPGQKVAGIIAKYENHPTSGIFAVVSPCLVRHDRNDKMTRYDSVAIGLTTDLRLKIYNTDIGKAIAIEFVDTEPTNKGSPRKVFRVLVLEREEMQEMAAAAEHMDGVYRKPPMLAQLADGGGEEEMPF